MEVSRAITVAASNCVVCGGTGKAPTGLGTSVDCTCVRSYPALQVETGGCAPPVYVEQSLPGLEPTPEPKQQSLPGIPYVPGAISFRSLGKQVLKDGVHYADAADPDAAEYIVHALNSMVAQTDWAYLIARVR